MNYLTHNRTKYKTALLSVVLAGLLLVPLFGQQAQAEWQVTVEATTAQTTPQQSILGVRTDAVDGQDSQDVVLPPLSPDPQFQSYFLFLQSSDRSSENYKAPFSSNETKQWLWTVHPGHLDIGADITLSWDVSGLPSGYQAVLTDLSGNQLANMNQTSSYSTQSSGNAKSYYVKVTSSEQTYNIEASAGDHGTISPSGTVTVSGGSDKTFTIDPDVGYKIKTVTVDGDPVDINISEDGTGTYQFTDITSDHRIHATFVQATVDISLSASPPAGGTVSGGGNVPYGTEVTVQATPAEDYNFVNWTENGTTVSTSSDYTFTATEDRNLVANFVEEGGDNVIVTPIAEEGFEGTSDFQLRPHPPRPPIAPTDAKWQIVDACRLIENASNYYPTRDFPALSTSAQYGKVAYFGITPQTPSYGANGAQKGALLLYLQNPAQLANYNSVILKFDYLRGVEHYTAGEYDITKVQYKTGNNWKNAVWTKTSKDSSAREFKQVSAKLDVTGITPTSGTLQIRFVFDTKDDMHNNFFGWLVDNIRILPPPVEITTSGLAQAYIGKPYDQNLAASGGKSSAQYKWQILTEDGDGEKLPDRLDLERSTGKITGTPHTPGTYQIVLQVRDTSVTDSSDSAADNPYVDRQKFTLSVSKSSNNNRGQVGNFRCWTKGGLWTDVDISKLPREVTGSAGKGNIAYYGDVRTHNYDEGSSQGYITSCSGCFVNDISSHVGQMMHVTFDSWRVVEQYSSPYDKTYVEVSFDRKHWKQVWIKDSTDDVNEAWEHEVTNSVHVPAGAKGIYVRMGFDAVDGLNNDYLGWIVDNVDVKFNPVELKIISPQPGEDKRNPAPLRKAHKDTKYTLDLKAKGGLGNLSWSWSPVTGGQLPPGLRLDRSKGKIQGLPQTSSHAYRFQVTVKDEQGHSCRGYYSLNIGEESVYYEEDFEMNEDDFTDNWKQTELWKLVQGNEVVPNSNHGQVAYYGQSSAQENYDVGKTSGNLAYPGTGPGIDITNADNIKISFDYWREVEEYDESFDVTALEVKTNQKDWTAVWKRDATDVSKKTWNEASVTINVSSASELSVRFRFDSIDPYYNNYTGWLVDNLVVKQTDDKGTSLSNFDISTELQTMRSVTTNQDITVMSVPNPVRDIHTTTFVARGVQADQIQVNIYNGNGKLVYQDTSSGNQLQWNAANNQGELLANGVYLYRTKVKVNGEWIVTGFRKLVILR